MKLEPAALFAAPPASRDSRAVLVVALNHGHAQAWLERNRVRRGDAVIATSWSKVLGTSPKTHRLALVPGWHRRRDALDLSRYLHGRGFDLTT